MTISFYKPVKWTQFSYHIYIKISLSCNMCTICSSSACDLTVLMQVSYHCVSQLSQPELAEHIQPICIQNQKRMVLAYV